MEMCDFAGRRAECARVFRIDAAFDRMALKVDVFLAKAQLGAGGDRNLLSHQIRARDLLGDRVFDLQSRIHFDEIKLTIFI